jgi:hypothetical protein
MTAGHSILRKSDHPAGVAIASGGESHHPPRKGYPQDALFRVNKVELSPVPNR